MGADYVLNPAEMSLQEVMHELDMTEGFDVGMEMSGAGPALQSMLEAMNHGGRVAILGISGRPIAPLSMRLFAAAHGGENRLQNPNWITRPASLAKAPIASLSLASSASGFSHNTWRPASIAVVTTAGWVAVGVAINHASTSSRSSNAAGEV